MTLWWPLALTTWQYYPWDTWFWAPIPVTAWGWPGYNTWDTYYWFRKISPSGGHKQQLAIRSDVSYPHIAGFQSAVQANVIYICCYLDDTPNWGSAANLVSISPPCANWSSALCEVPNQVTRSQTYGIEAAVRGNPERATRIRAAVAKTDYLDCGISATVSGIPELPVTMRAAISGDAALSVPTRAAIRAERLLEPSIVAAVGKAFDLDTGISATIQGNPERPCHMRAAIKGTAEKSVGIKAFVVKSRVENILIEMENLWPQEFDLRSTPNWASRVKDYRKDSLGT